MEDNRVTQGVQFETIAISKEDEANIEALEYVRRQINEALRLRLFAAVVFGVSLPARSPLGRKPTNE